MRETLAHFVHPLRAEGQRDMASLKFGLTPEPAVAQAQPDVPATSSHSPSSIRAQYLFDTAVSLLGTLFNDAQVLSRQLADILVVLLTPAAVTALVMGLWRLGTDLGWAGAFFISEGFFSHWQVWIALSIGLKAMGSMLIAWGERTAKVSEEN